MRKQEVYPRRCRDQVLWHVSAHEHERGSLICLPPHRAREAEEEEELYLGGKGGLFTIEIAQERRRRRTAYRFH